MSIIISKIKRLRFSLYGAITTSGRILPEVVMGDAKNASILQKPVLDEFSAHWQKMASISNFYSETTIEDSKFERHRNQQLRQQTVFCRHNAYPFVGAKREFVGVVILGAIQH